MKTTARLACALLWLAAAPCAADEFASAPPGAPATPAWLSLGMGVGDGPDAYAGGVGGNSALLLAASAQHGPNIFTARVTHLGNRRDDGDIALLYEHAFSRRRWLVSAGFGIEVRLTTGPGWVCAEGGTACGKSAGDKSAGGSSDGSVGLAWSLQAVTRKHDAVGVGVIAYGSANPDDSLVGVGLVVHVGRLGKGAGGS